MADKDGARAGDDYPRLIWIDLEMSGLDVETSTILEIASLVTDSNLEILEEGPDLAVSQPKSVLDGMDAWNTEHHGDSGLTQRVLESDVTMAAAEAATLAFLAKWCEAGASPLCGNTVSHDRNFINRYMPTLGKFFHYRHVDVSSVKELVRRWYGEDVLPPKQGAHRALDDIRESVEELRHYRQVAFRSET